PYQQGSVRGASPLVARRTADRLRGRRRPLCDERRWLRRHATHQQCVRLGPRLAAAGSMNTPRMLRRWLIGTSLCLLAACRPDSTAPGGGRPAVSVSIVPTTASLLTSGSQDFAAIVANDPS